MMQSTFHLLFAAGIGALIVGLYLSESRPAPSWLAPPTTLGAAFLLVVVSVQAASIEVATDSGIETTSEPTLGIIAGILAVIAFILALVMTILWFPSDRIRGDRRGI